MNQQPRTIDAGVLAIETTRNRRSAAAIGRQLARILPGLGLALSVALIAQHLAVWLGGVVLSMQGLDPVGRGSPISGVSIAVILGLLVANTVGVSPIFGPGIDFAVKKVLRLGIILVGIKLSVIDVLKVGSIGIPIVAALVLFALGVTLWLAKRLGVSPQLGSLAAASTAICGITATIAIAPSIEADDKEVAYTVANVTVLGLLGMLVYPYLAHWIFGDGSGAAGLFLGTAIHDTSQVMGAALSYREVFADERAMQVATVAKLSRNMMLVLVVPLLALLHARRSGAGSIRSISLGKLFPLFVLGFLVLSLVRSIGDLGLDQGGGLAFGLWSASAWTGLTSLLGEKAALLALGTALAGVGLTTRLSAFKGLGWTPLLLGSVAALVVAIASLLLSTWAGPLLG